MFIILITITMEIKNEEIPGRNHLQDPDLIQEVHAQEHVQTVHILDHTDQNPKILEVIQIEIQGVQGTNEESQRRKKDSHL